MSMVFSSHNVLCSYFKGENIISTSWMMVTNGRIFHLNTVWTANFLIIKRISIRLNATKKSFLLKKKKKMNGTDVAWLILIRALNSLVHSEEAKDQCLIKNRSVLAILIAGWWFAIIWSLRSLWNSCLFQKRNQSYIY